MFVIDRLRQIAANLGVQPANNLASGYLIAIEDKLNLGGHISLQFGNRVKRVEQALIGHIKAIQPNTRVVYVGTLPSLADRRATYVGLRDGKHPRPMASVQFDNDNRIRVVELSNLVSEMEYDMTKLTNFKIVVANSAASLLAVLTGDSIKEQAVRRLGVAAELVRVGEAAKKQAKNALSDLGLIRDDYNVGSEVVFDSTRYVMTAETKTPAVRLDKDLLDGALVAAGLSRAKINQVMAKATVQNKAATSFRVEVK